MTLSVAPDANASVMSPAPLPAVVPQTSAVVASTPRMALLPTAHEYTVYLELAEKFIESGFMPKAIQKPAQALAIMLTGRELGLMPMQSLRMLHVIEGKPGMAAELQLGRFKQAGGRFRWLETNDKIARLQVIAPGDPVEWAQTFEFTWDEAIRAKVTGKDNWQKYPAAMLRARAASLAIRAVAPDVSAGLYDPDELGAVTNESGEVVQWPEPEKRQERKQERKPEPQPDDDPILPIRQCQGPGWTLSNRECHIGLVLYFLTLATDGVETSKKYMSLIQKCYQIIPQKIAEASMETLTKTHEWIAQDDAREKLFKSEHAAIVDRMEAMSKPDVGEVKDAMETIAAADSETIVAAATNEEVARLAADSDPDELFDEAGPGGTFALGSNEPLDS